VKSAVALPPPVVFVVDDDPSVREAIDSLIRSVGLCLETFSCAKEFLRRERPGGPVCLVLDVRLPDRSGLQVQRELLARDCALPIIFITGHGDIPMSVQAMKAGAFEFLTKPFRDQDLLEAVQHAIEHDRAALEQGKELAELRARYCSLTQREREIMRFVIAGRMNKLIASELGTTEINVKIHRCNMMKKLCICSLADLVWIAQKLGIKPVQAVSNNAS
jgi:FixJ family two-component response regulator